MDELIYKQDVISAIIHDWDGLVVSLPTLIKSIPSAQQWISCEKKLPEAGQHVRISAYGRVFDAVYEGLSFDHTPVWVSHGCVYWADEVSRWMPLPDPIEEETDG